MSITSDPREAKLPQWARNELAAARRRADDAERRLADHRETVAPTGLEYGEYAMPLYLPENEVLRWSFGTGVRDQISVLRFRGGLSVSGGGPIVIAPSASNTFDVRLRDQ